MACNVGGTGNRPLQQRCIMHTGTKQLLLKNFKAEFQICMLLCKAMLLAETSFPGVTEQVVQADLGILTSEQVRRVQTSWIPFQPQIILWSCEQLSS